MAINEKQKWPTDKEKYDKEYLRIFGRVCSKCSGDGYILGKNHLDPCEYCKGLGYVPK